MPVVDILKKMISFDTSNPPGNEAILSAWIADYLSPYGFEVEQPSCGDNRKSIIASLKMGPGPKIVLNGHLDVVPAGEGWDQDPFEAVTRDGRLYGRGSADMKGGVAAMICAAERIANSHSQLSGELCLVFVADEEVVNLGNISCRNGWLDADCVVIGEPTEMQIEIAHKGTARFKISVEGKSCHSSMPWNGVNAIVQATKVIGAIREFDESLKQITHPLLSRPSVAVTMIEGGEKDNIIPDNCNLYVDYRMIPGDTGDSVEKKLNGYLEAIGKEDDKFSCTVSRYINLEPGEISMDHPFVQEAAHVFEDTFGKEPVIRDFPATCEQVLFTREHIPAIVMGPGSIEQAHIRNEYVEISQLEEAADYYEALARKVLAGGQGVVANE